MPAETQRPAQNRISDWIARAVFKRKTAFLTRQELSASMLFLKWRSSLLSQDPAAYASKRAQRFKGRDLVYLDSRNTPVTVSTSEIIYSKTDDTV
jgi:polysaccharide pyruvyl transferase WcaK-like protein